MNLPAVVDPVVHLDQLKPALVDVEVVQLIGLVPDSHRTE
jgi:hypothetical protein